MLLPQNRQKNGWFIPGIFLLLIRYEDDKKLTIWSKMFVHKAHSVTHRDRMYGTPETTIGSWKVESVHEGFVFPHRAIWSPAQETEDLETDIMLRR